MLLLLRPRYLSFRNRWFQRIDLRSQAGRDVFLAVFACLVVFGIYAGTSWALAKVNANPELTHFPPANFIGLVLMLLQFMLLISAVLSTLAVFFFADDLELINASPITRSNQFVGKFLYVLWTASWMPFVFIIPFLAAFAQAYGTGLKVFVPALICLLPYFTIPAALGVFVGFLIVLIVPPHRVREVVIISLIGAAVMLYQFFVSYRFGMNANQNVDELLRMISLLSAPSAVWFPSTWVALSLQEALKPSGYSWHHQLGLLWSAAIAALSLAYGFFLVTYDATFSRSRNRRISRRVRHSALDSFIRFCTRGMPPRFRALWAKEVRTVTRDMGQAVQLLMLLGISLVYLYHLRIFSTVESFPEHIRPWWKSFLFGGNVAMGAFITTAICTRFVYPSLSLEGRSLWILQTSPLYLKELMRIKFLSWFFPISIISSIFFMSGAMVIGTDAVTIGLNALLSIVVCYGLVGVAVGMGALFAQFDWEHSSQLAAGIGSLLFMIAATSLIFFDMLPGWFLLNSKGPQQIERILSFTFFIVLLNFYAAKVAMSTGYESLKERLSA